MHAELQQHVMQLLAAGRRDEQREQLQHARELLGALQPGHTRELQQAGAPHYFLGSSAGTAEQPLAAALPMLLQARHHCSSPPLRSMHVLVHAREHSGLVFM